MSRDLRDLIFLALAYIVDLDQSKEYMEKPKQ